MSNILTIINQDGVVLAYLNNLESASVHKVINGEYVLDFVAIIEELKTEFLYDDSNLIVYDNDYFRVVTLDDEHDSNNMLKVTVSCEHISYDLIKQTKLTFTHENRAAIYVMNDLLTDSGYTFTGTDVTTTASIDVQSETDIKSLLYQVAIIWGGEIEYFRKDIALKQQLGQNRGTDFRFGKNMEHVRRSIDKVDGTVSYEVDVVQGSELEELGYYDLGDTVRVVDDALNIELDIRIIDLERDLVTGMNGKVVLGEPIKDLSTNITNIKRTVKATADKVNGVIDEHGKLIAEKLSGTLNDAIETVEGQTGYVTFDNRGILIHNQPTEAESTWVILLSSGGILIANAKDNTGKWIWRTAVTGESISANEITTGTLTAININGVTITGSKITSASAETNIVMDNGTLTFKRNNDSGQIKFGYRDGMPNGITAGDLNDFNEYSSGIPSSEKTLTIEASDANIGFDLGSKQFALRNNNGIFQMVGGTVTINNTDYPSAHVNIYVNGYSISFPELGIYGSTGQFNVEGGTKNAVIDTPTYGKICYSAYEMSEVLLGDIGESKVEKGRVKIPIHQALQESTLTDLSYHVFLTKYGKGDIWVSERHQTYFVVEGDNIPFSWEIKASRKDCASHKFMPADMSGFVEAIKEEIEGAVETFSVPTVENSKKLKQKELYKSMLKKNKK